MKKFWLKVNSGNIGPLESKQDAQNKYRDLLKKTCVLSASIWQGNDHTPVKLVYTIA